MKQLQDKLNALDLTKIDQRGEYLRTISLIASDQLTELGILNTRVRISDSQIEIGLQEQGDEFYATEFGSEITFYHKEDCPMRGKVESEINHGSTGAYNLNNKVCVWRAKTITSILDNWKAVEAIAIKATELRKVLFTIKIES